MKTLALGLCQLGQQSIIHEGLNLRAIPSAAKINLETRQLI